ncbi:ParA family protein (plasmid) [Humibacter sp. BT305]|nr:ParA family protein [Humibacter sp. BT305]
MPEIDDRQALQRVVAVINNKGGVGKTTLAANLGGLLAASGWRVLIVDLDPQGNLGLDLGYRGTPQDDDGRALFTALVLGSDMSPVSVRDNLDVVIGGSMLEQAAAALSSSAASRQADSRLTVASALAPLAADYDIILLDCPPSSDIIQSAAVVASRYVLVPVKTDRASLEGLALTASRLSEVIDLNPQIDLLGIVLFATGTSAMKVRNDFVSQIVSVLVSDGAGPDEVEDARERVFASFVRHAEATANSARDKGLLVHELDAKVQRGPKWYERLRTGEPIERVGPASAKSVADDLQAVTKEFIERLTAMEQQSETEGATHGR